MLKEGKIYIKYIAWLYVGISFRLQVYFKMYGLIYWLCLFPICKVASWFNYIHLYIAAEIISTRNTVLSLLILWSLISLNVLVPFIWSYRDIPETTGHATAEGQVCLSPEFNWVSVSGTQVSQLHTDSLNLLLYFLSASLQVGCTALLKM